MENKLENIISLYHSDDYTLVIDTGTTVYYSREPGLYRLLSFAESKAFLGSYAADRIVGKAAAMIYILLGFNAVYAEIISTDARSLFDKYHIAYQFGKTVDHIISHNGRDICPLEKALNDIYDPKAAPAILRETLASLTK